MSVSLSADLARAATTDTQEPIRAAAQDTSTPEYRAKVQAAAEKFEGFFIAQMLRQMVGWEPSLKGKNLRLQLGTPVDATEVVGSLQLADGSWLHFRAQDMLEGWPLALRRMLAASLPSIALVLIALITLRVILRPLGLLADAVTRVGQRDSIVLPEQGPSEFRRLIRAYNESTNTPNTDTGGYHETITQASLRAVRAAAAAGGSPVEVLHRLLETHGRSDWLLKHWSRERLFSVEARRGWVEPDLAPL